MVEFVAKYAELFRSCASSSGDAMRIPVSIQEGALLMMSPRRSEGNDVNVVLKFIPAIAILVTIGVTFGVAQTQINRAQTDIDQLQENHRFDHDSLVEIRQDLKHIRKRLDDVLEK